MAFNLYINGSTPTWDEFGAQAHDRLIELKGQLAISKGFLDPLTGLFSAMPLYTPADDDGNWTFSDSNDWITPKSSIENRKTVQYHKDTDTNWTATRSTTPWHKVRASHSTGTSWNLRAGPMTACRSPSAGSGD